MTWITLYDGVVLIIAAVLHELGHYIYDWAYSKRRPKIGFKYGLIYVDEDTSIYTLKHKVLLHLAGIAAGLIPILIFNVSGAAVLIYVIMSGLDFASVYGVLMAQDKYKVSINSKVDDLPCPRCKKLEEKIKALESRLGENR
jgi:hypothetical protein